VIAVVGVFNLANGVDEIVVEMKNKAGTEVDPFVN
jgi:hypothetical protein